MTTREKVIGVFFGSRSPEHDVSILTGQLVIAGLKRLGHRVTPVYIGKDGRWYIDDRLGKLAFFQKSDYPDLLRGLDRFSLDLEASFGKLVFKKKGWSNTQYTVDIAFPTFHGPHGEDGTMQGLFEMLNVPYVGCDVASSAITMDKVLTKLLYEKHSIPTTKFISFNRNEWEKYQKDILKAAEETLTWPVFVKPARAGSSIGITKVKELGKLAFAIEVALAYDKKALIEESVENLADITCAVIGNDTPKPSLLQESAFEGEFFDYQEKYIKGGGTQTGQAEKNIIIPARLDQKTTEATQKLAIHIFKLFGCSGIARVDFLYDKTSRVAYANEINTLPGTLYQHLWKASGIELGELVTELLRLAEERHAEKQSVTYTFDSDILKQASVKKFSLKLQ